ncbi:MAG: diacylglycerol kinase family lipid kinase [Clostridia bacterium]|nr:diacylglycerol kinase family lipid kinase [Lachnospiraceae bacterium]NCC00933.1 diacylglycerol kinase family lipid kinase [Clostridia bacterium]NCD02407.1 diacylglycerol kinase family lipid kinase [Clostridia bacterium]
MKAKFIINPASGKQNFLKNIESVVGCLVLNQVVNQVDVVYTQNEGDARKEAAAIKRAEYDFLVAVGGDGTLNDVVNGLMEGGSETPLAVISVGTANDFAQYAKPPETPEAFCKMIMEFKLRCIDVGKINDRYFLNRVSGGIGANVGDRVSQERKAVLGKLAYYMEGALDVSRKGVKTLKVRFDSPQFKGEREVMSFTVINACGSFGMYRGLPEMDPYDGLFDVLIVKKMDLGQMPVLGLQALAKRMTKHPKVRHFRTEQIHIEAADDTEIVVDFDGQEYGKLPVDLSIVPKALKLIIP